MYQRNSGGQGGGEQDTSPKTRRARERCDTRECDVLIVDLTNL
jgi:hypothetical protein